MKKRRVPPALVATVREFVSRTADVCGVSEVEAVELVGRALAKVAVEVVADDVRAALTG